MNPIYATPRIDLSGWYAFECPNGVPVIWDGGMTPTMDCLYNAYTLEPVKCPWLNELPNTPLVGWMTKDEFIAFDSPHPSILAYLLPLEVMPNIKFCAAHGDIELPAPFFYTLNMIEDLGGRVTTPGITILPENRELAFEKFQELHVEADQYARSPIGPWVPRLCPLFACSVKPPIRKYARLRDYELDEDGEVCLLEFWVGVSKTIEVEPLYRPDLQPELFERKSAYTLYLSPYEEVIGYEKA